MKELYFTSYWITKLVGDDVEIYALMGALIMLIICIVSYVIARKIYLKNLKTANMSTNTDTEKCALFS